MSMEFVCPSCHVKARTQKDLPPGTSIRCPSCSTVFQLAVEAPRPAASSVRRPAPPRAEERTSAVRREEPRSSSRRRDDDDYDRPRKRRRPKKEGINPVAIIAGVAAVVLIGVGILVTVLYLSKKSEKEAAEKTYISPQANNGQFFQGPGPGPNFRGNPPRGNAPGPDLPDPGIPDNDPLPDPPQPPLRPGPNRPTRPPQGNPDPPAAPEMGGDEPLMPISKPTDAKALIGPPPAAKPPSTDAAPFVNGGVLPPDILKRVKKATVYVRVPTSKGLASGSGFFAGNNKDIVLTNAHVIDMLHPDNPPPKRIDVVLNSGEGDEVSFRGDVLAVDRIADLAVLKITPGDGAKAAVMPEPLPIAGANLQETQQVFIFGFPHGESLGKNVTVSASSVSSLRKTPEGELDQVQVNGGMTHGNSGGPVVDAAGHLIGVAVSVIEATQINFAIPSERVNSILDGRLSTIVLGEPVRRGARMTFAVEVEALDPLNRVKGLALDWWWGDPASKVPAVRGAAAQPGDVARATVIMRPLGMGKYAAEITFPTSIPSNKVMWLQAHHATATDPSLYMQGVSKEIDSPPELKAALLAFRPKMGSAKLDLKSTNTLTFRAPDGDSKTLLFNIETLMSEEARGLDQTGQAVQYLLGIKERGRDRFAVGISLDGKPARGTASLGEAVKNDIGKMELLMTLDQTGDLAEMKTGWAQSISPESRKMLGRFSNQIGQSIDFASIRLPNGQIRPGFAWQGQRDLPIPITPDEDALARVNVLYTYRGLRKFNGKNMAVVTMSGRLDSRGRNAGIAGTTSGTLLVDLVQGRVAKANVTVDSTLAVRIPELGSKPLQARSRLEVKLVRQ